MAVHEAGHAVLAVVLGAGEIVSLSVNSHVARDARGDQDGGGLVTHEAGLSERTREQLLNGVATLLGGLAAEEVVLGQRSAGGGGSKGSDLHAATVAVLKLEASYGLGESLAYLASSNEEELFTALRLDRLLQARVDKVLAEQFARTKRIVEAHRADVDRLTEALLERGALSGEEVRELVASQPRFQLVGGAYRWVH